MSLEARDSHKMSAIGFQLSRTALAVGGGGVVAAAWYAGVVQGLIEEGIDLRRVRTIQGTSAGAWASAWFAGHADPSNLVEALMMPPDDFTGPPEENDIPPSLKVIYEKLASATEPNDRKTLARIGRIASTAPMPVTRYFRRRLPDIDWPSPLRAIAIEAATGKEIAIGAGDKVPLPWGIAASCAAPGIGLPVPINGSLCYDAMARSSTNADLLAGDPVSHVIILSGITRSMKPFGQATERTIQHETACLNEHGKIVIAINPRDEDIETLGRSLMNPSRIPAAVESGRCAGAREAARLSS